MTWHNNAFQLKSNRIIVKTAIIVGMCYKKRSIKISITIAINQFGLIAIKGESTVDFLQGQLTCDVREVSTKRGILGACCDNKGRMIANFFILQKNQEYYLLLPKSMIPLTIIHLKKYAIFFESRISHY